MTIDELAAASGVPKGTINKIIAGTTRSPTLETVQALAAALGKRINDFIPSEETKNAPSVSDEAMKIAKIYDKLDNYGREAVRGLAMTEKKRCEDEERLLREATAPWDDNRRERKMIPDYLYSPAAGPLVGVTGQESRPYFLTENDPQNAVYTTVVWGDSMAPDFPDGCRVFVNNEPMRDGDIGIFCVDGANVIKQWHYDEIMGITYLLSLNRSRADADVVITPNSGRTAVWQGRVITHKHYPLPRR